MSDLQQSLFLKALRGEPVPRPPIWIMRQAGRYLPEYMKVREAISFNDLCRTPEAACEVTLQPIRRFGFDAAIMFSDILTPLAPMGAEFAFGNGGPQLARPLRDERDFAALRTYPSLDGVPFVAEAIRLMKRELGDKTPLIGFAGAPFTLATYLIEGGGSKNYENLKTVLYSRPELLRGLLEKLGDQILDYLRMQVAAGVDAVQLFDTWGGILHPADYAALVLPVVRRIMDGLKDTGVPRIYFLKGSTPYNHLLRDLDVECCGIDWTQDLSLAIAQLPGKAVQGNLDPLCLFGSAEQIRDRALAICRQGAAAPGHVFNLGHGILPQASLTAVQTLVETVQGFTKE
ncbi:uroporphyrinogen decarboxylase [bacterium CG17_big_fil_post_rev_8_21_14_2_50_64_8]|nr:MAG: uroporphyrinogen decarboxylase [bacterium CG17_big_fil_post_rev_8_21_14_2_50_64_8]PJA76791.1 MAG: uroporphyrinogen decarboxylase [bacterium CG_4_9_14_3_um_filter_65_15]